MLLTLAWRNLWRQRRRTLVTSAAMAIGIALSMGIISFQDGFNGQMKQVMVEQRLGHVQLHHPDYPGRRVMHDVIPNVSALVADLKAQPEVLALAPRLSGAMLLGGEKKSDGGVLTGVDPTLERVLTDIQSFVVEGRYLADEPAGEIVLGQDFAPKLGVGIGDTVVALTQSADGSMGNELYTVVGLVSTGDAQLDRMGGHLHIADLQDLLVLPDSAHSVTLLSPDPDHLDGFAALLRERLGEGVMVRTWFEVNPQVAQMLAMTDSANLFVLCIVLMVAAIVVLNTMMMVVFERTRELGVLGALGMQPRQVVLLVMAEAFFLAMVSVFVGLALGGALDWYLVTQGFKIMDEDMVFSGVRFSGRMYGVFDALVVAQVALAAVFFSIVATIWPAWRAARMQPVQAMREH